MVNFAELGDFFEKHQRRMFGDRIFYLLYDIVTEKVEEYILLPLRRILRISIRERFCSNVSVYLLIYGGQYNLQFLAYTFFVK